MHDTDLLLDCLIVGGGAAGLTAAVYLSRFQRLALVVDTGESRLLMIAKSRNVLGFPDGIVGADLHQRLREHARRYGARHETGRVDRITPRPEGGFEVSAGARRWCARTVLMATGARDLPPDVENLECGLANALVRYCPVCDGFETRGKRVAVLGKGSHGASEATFVAGFANNVTWLSVGSEDDVGEEHLRRLRDKEVRVVGASPKRIRCFPGEGVDVEMHDGDKMHVEVLYAALGLKHASELAVALGAEARADGQLIVDAHMRTKVPGLYAAGDVAEGLNQISVAGGQAAIAATAIHNSLLDEADRSCRSHPDPV